MTSRRSTAPRSATASPRGSHEHRHPGQRTRQGLPADLGAARLHAGHPRRPRGQARRPERRGHVIYESRLELTRLIFAAFGRAVHAACCEPVLKNWTAALHDEMRRHNESACRALPDASGRKFGVLRLAGSSRLYELGVGVVWPTSLRWPSGSRMYARISRPWSLGSVRNSAPLADQILDAVAMSVTRMLRKAPAWSGSVGVVRMTVGLTPVVPPPPLRMSCAFATSKMTGSRSSRTFPPNTDW